MDLEPAQVRAFVVTAELRNFSRAAEKLFLSQQALSKRIGRLEHVLGVSLFARTNRAVELTHDGARFLPHAEEFLRAHDAALSAWAADDRPVRIDLVDNRLSPMFMLRRLAERDPALRVERSWRHGLANTMEPLLRGEVDLAFGRVGGHGTELAAELTHRLVRLEPLVALLPPEHRLADGPAVRMTDLREEGIWLPSLAGPAEWLGFLRAMSDQLGVALDDSGITFDLRHTLEQTRNAENRVTLAGADMDLAPDLGLRVLPFEPSPLFPWSVIWRKDMKRPSVRKVLDLAGETSEAEGWCEHDPERCWLAGLVSAGTARTRR
ncbi:LysR family transcriptional regulator [Prauserella marina]|uniref:DNA-binding transcriptional regulator, LysR family n=1 Tax=Prauserella marina TaxID=530584 RepID=A0A222VTL3_9PSEU|nr:LysR family transcriptional regulator [Prauserella marina]ASR37172.1 LysR family transcriptional regulator [Prauserella marina]PWV72483.1 DNA-binding transcriptional LysR family regulator [Prauserella marina]SDD78990.1 DNA-binding transcriptional regulator, LysR family [Prauserella marina]